jgi:hypothetical protein
METVTSHASAAEERQIATPSASNARGSVRESADADEHAFRRGRARATISTLVMGITDFCGRNRILLT